MKFLDKKEQVLDIQLTQYGKRLLSNGKFKPHSYAFFDDDIIYDTAWAGHNEEQNESEGRILESIRSEVQYNFSGVETKIKEQNIINTQLAQNETDKELTIGPLNNADPFSEYVPAWDIKMLDNQIESFAKTYKATSLELKIPQLEVLFNYDIKISVADTPPHEGTFEPMDQPIEGSMLSPDAPQFIFADGTYHYLEATNKELFARVLEQNTNFLNENFDIEVYKVNEDEELEKLYFINKRQSNIKDGILLDESPQTELLDFGPQYVEYYFDLLVDDEIPNETYCKVISKDVLEDIYSDKELFNCDELEEDKEFSDLYRISKKADEDPC
tara:strand:- start:568 stop:1554 length:987 start_codon:yes stop_codon:yes gene_type:complete